MKPAWKAWSCSWAGTFCRFSVTPGNLQSLKDFFSFFFFSGYLSIACSQLCAFDPWPRRQAVPLMASGSQHQLKSHGCKRSSGSQRAWIKLLQVILPMLRWEAQSAQGRGGGQLVGHPEQEPARVRGHLQQDRAWDEMGSCQGREANASFMKIYQKRALPGRKH